MSFQMQCNRQNVEQIFFFFTNTLIIHLLGLKITNKGIEHIKVKDRKPNSTSTSPMHQRLSDYTAFVCHRAKK